MFLKHVFVTLLTLGSFLLTPVLAFPGDSDSEDSLPPSAGLSPLLKTLQRIEISGIKLDRTLTTSEITAETLQTIRQLTDEIEGIVAQATTEAHALDVLDPFRSSKLTKSALPMKPVLGHLLNVIVDVKEEICAADFCQDMQDFLTWMRIHCHELAESLRGILQFGDGKLIEICADLVDKQYALTITQYEKIIRSGKGKDKMDD
ncbi:uncharacterized protein BP01DRAFT_369386 [Aspergillus saccharolyticus JOP 1030-1]|uniref:Secreted protein n=1 Tax=Aspergillus saccharolyticus JOP 1030-1 TaxID=1450539 RepID=A0A318Z2C5_9EURO|nr:hypothetical protein BP01DRAFT_369386 [Aspergillus saccharolyticus JOP 1030-1]PYH41109.1 hypothetical protein BP01DRAFT_369386 [Aspergillus saccharolyticus JOP 1030-1]